MGDQVRIYADKEEQKQMLFCHPYCIQILKKFMGRIVHRKLFRALDVAGGDGRLTAGFLLKYYRKVDHFDQCPVAIKQAIDTIGNHERMGYF